MERGPYSPLLENKKVICFLRNSGTSNWTPRLQLLFVGGPCDPLNKFKAINHCPAGHDFCRLLLSSAPLVCSSRLLVVAYNANAMDPDQRTPFGAI